MYSVKFVGLNVTTADNQKLINDDVTYLALRHSVDCEPCRLRNSPASNPGKPAGSAETKMAELTRGRLHRASRCSSHSRLCVCVWDQRICCNRTVWFKTPVNY